MKTYLIYKYTSPSGKGYIGQTCNFKKRQNVHKNLISGCECFVNAIKKYGYENFILEILEEQLVVDEANMLEELYIEQHNTMVPNGYNLQTGGLNHSVTEETLIKQRSAKMGKNNYWFGKHHSEESKLKMSESRTGENHPLYGKFQSIESNNKRRNSLLGNLNHMFNRVGIDNPNSKKYIITFPDGHEEIIIGLAEFCRKNNLSDSAMSQVAKTTSKNKTHKKFKCKKII